MLEEKKPKNVPLTRDQQHKIRALIRTWKTKFTWKRLVDAASTELKIDISRQSLQGYDAIKHDYDAKKAEYRGVTPEIANRVTMSDIKAQEKIEKLEAELKIKNETIDKQLVLIRTMLANANEITNYDVQNIMAPRRD